MKIKQLTAGATGLAFMICSATAMAGSTDMEALQQKIDQIVHQNQQLTKKIAVMEAEMQAMKAAQQEAVSAPPVVIEEESEGLASQINKNVSLSGAIEVEMGWAEDFEGGEESDISLATAEIALEAQVTEWATALMALEWDDEEDKIAIDETFITIGNTERYPLYTQVGRYVVPFGIFDGNTIADPLTKEVFETKEDAILVGAEYEGFQGGLYIFNGDTNDGGGDDHIGQWGVNLGYGMENDTLAFDASIGYINSVIDSDGLTGVVEEIQSEADDMGASYDPDSNFLNTDDVGGVAINAGLRIADFVFLAEFITATEDYETRYAIMGIPMSVEVQPLAYHFEAGYNFILGEYPSLISLAFSGSDDLLGYLPENRFAVDFGIELFEGVGLSFEYIYDQDYDESEGGTGESANGFLTQLAYEF